jgi:CDP-glucose 4,6-dehydratase
MGTAHLLEAVKNLEKPCQVVVITTDKVYENLEKQYAYKETDKLGGFDPYSSSKACAEIITNSYRLSFFNPEKQVSHGKALATARSGNVIGGGDWSADRIVPDMIRAFQRGERLQVRNPNAIRPWQHVLEPLSGYLLLGNHLEKDPVSFADAFNFGPKADDQLSVKELVKIAIDSWGAGEFEHDINADNPHEARLLQLDIQKAERQLGWTPKLDSREAISQTIQWYKEYESDPLGCLTRQIVNYFES